MSEPCVICMTNDCPVARHEAAAAKAREAARIAAGTGPHTPETCGLSDCIIGTDHVHDRDLDWKGPYR